MQAARIHARPLSKRPFALYAGGHAALLLGAWAMHVSGSMWPMALAASASMMLTVPLVRQVVAVAAGRRWKR